MGVGDAVLVGSIGASGGGGGTSLTSAAGVLGANYTVTGSIATFLTTASLATGTWLLTFTANVQTQTASGNGPDINVTANGTGSGTFAGPTNSGAVSSPTSVSITVPAVISTVLTVTVQGTFTFRAGGGGQSGAVILAGSPNGGFASGGTGYTALKVA